MNSPCATPFLGPILRVNPRKLITSFRHMKQNNYRYERLVGLFLKSVLNRIESNLKIRCLSIALGLLVLCPPTLGEVVGYFKFDTFPGDNAYFTDDTGKGLR